MDIQLKPHLRDILVRYGAETGTDLDAYMERAIEQLQAALAETSNDGQSLSALDVLRIRFGKLAAFVLPPALFRDPQKLAQLRAELHTLARSLVSDEDAAASRFPKGPDGAR